MYSWLYRRAPEQAAEQAVETVTARQEVETTSDATVQFGAGAVEALVVGIDLDTVTDGIDGTFAIIAVPFCAGEVQEDITIEHFVTGRFTTKQQAILITIQHSGKTIARKQKVILLMVIADTVHHDAKCTLRCFIIFGLHGILGQLVGFIVHRNTSSIRARLISTLLPQATLCTQQYPQLIKKQT